MDELEIKNRKKVRNVLIIEVIFILVLAISAFGGALFPVSARVSDIRTFLYFLSTITLFVFGIIGFVYVKKIAKSILKRSSYFFSVISLIIGILSVLQLIVGLFLVIIVSSSM